MLFQRRKLMKSSKCPLPELLPTPPIQLACPSQRLIRGEDGIIQAEYLVFVSLKLPPVRLRICVDSAGGRKAEAEFVE
jgi:hypothetical protein